MYNDSTAFVVLFHIRIMYYISRKQRPILYSNLLYKIGHYFLDTQYDKFRASSLGEDEGGFYRKTIASAILILPLLPEGHLLFSIYSSPSPRYCHHHRCIYKGYQILFVCKPRVTSCEPESLSRETRGEYLFEQMLPYHCTNKRVLTMDIGLLVTCRKC